MNLNFQEIHSFYKSLSHTHKKIFRKSVQEFQNHFWSFPAWVTLPRTHAHKQQPSLQEIFMDLETSKL